MTSLGPEAGPRRARVVLAVLLPLLGGCATGDVVLEQPGAGYVRGAGAAPSDWSEAEVVEVTLSEYRFTPANLEFRAEVPYRLVLRNTGTSAHTFVSEGFFKAIAAHKLVSAGTEIGKPYLASIGIPAGGRKELYFVPVRKGTYHLQCTVFLHEAFGMEGNITVR